MTLEFGTVPKRASFTLSSDADFYTQVATSDASNLPGTAVFTIKFYNSADAVVGSYVATVATDTATWQVDKADVATLLAATPTQGRIYYEDGAGGPELLLVQGVVNDVSL